MENSRGNFVSFCVDQLAQNVSRLVVTGTAALGLTVAGGLSTAAEFVPQESTAVVQEGQSAPTTESTESFDAGKVLSPIQLGLGLALGGLAFAGSRKVRRQERSE